MIFICLKSLLVWHDNQFKSFSVFTSIFNYSCDLNSGLVQFLKGPFCLGIGHLITDHLIKDKMNRAAKEMVTIQKQDKNVLYLNG
jgi:hypothetical protein